VSHEHAVPSAASEPSVALEHLNLLQVARRRKWLILLGSVVGLSLAALYAKLAGPWYESTAQVLVLKKRLDTSPISGPNPDSRPTEDYVPTHLQIITSPRVVEQAVKKGSLQSLRSFENAPSPTNEITGSLAASADVPKPGNTPSHEILNISFRGQDPGDCQKVLNAVLVSYQDYLKDIYRNVNAETLELITRARNVLQQDLEAREAAYLEFRRNTPVVWKGKDGNTLHQDRLFTIDGKRSVLRMRRAEIDGSLAAVERALKSGRSRAELLAIVSGLPTNREILSPSLLTTPEAWNGMRAPRATLEEELINLQLHEGKLLESYGSAHPEVQAARKRIESIRGMMAPASGDSGKRSGQRGREEELISMKIDLLKQELKDTQAVEKSLDELFERDQKEAKISVMHEIQEESHRQGIERSKLLYESIVKRLQEIDTVRDYGGYDTQVLAQPEIGKLYLRKYAIIFGLAFFFGLVAGSGWALLAEVRDKSFRSLKEMRSRLGLPVVGHIPVLRPAPEALLQRVNGASLDPLLCTYYGSNSAEAEAYRAVRTALYFGNHGNGSKIIQITSPDEGDGKTTVAANLAVSIAQSGKSVLLVDADLRNPRLHEVFAIRNEVGVTSLLAGDADGQTAIQQTNIPRLSVLPSGPATRHPSELLTSPRLKELFDRLRQEYDFVLIDTPALLGVTDASVVAPQVDGVLLNLRLSKNARPRAQRAREILGVLGARMLGVVVNGGTPFSSNGSGY